MLQFRSTRIDPPSVSFILFVVMLITLFWAGGSSRADVMGQAVVRGISSACLIGTIILFDRTGPLPPRTIGWLLGLAIVMPLLQLVPMPPAIWQALPSRTILIQAEDGPSIWRPLSINPDATLNAAASLLVPLTILLLVGSLRMRERSTTLWAVIAFTTAAMLVGLAEFAGVSIGNSLINGALGTVDGPFANRNHFALLMAIGCVAAAAWATQRREQRAWRVPAAISLKIIFCLLILACGSRFGVALGAGAVLLGLLIMQDELRELIQRLPRWARISTVGAAVAMIGALLAVSILSGRAQSLDRAIELDAGEDLRFRAMPTVMEIIRDGLPVGFGFGSFDTAFRISEPMDLLRLTYFNHAHNDFLEIVLDGGVFAGILVLAVIGWWGRASIRVWRGARSPQIALGRAGSSTLLLILLASTVDYPARTPIIMAFIVIASLWLSWASEAMDERPLPRTGQAL